MTLSSNPAALESLVNKAAILHEALPYIREFHGEVFVIKYGGHAMVDEALRDSFARDVVLMKYVGLHPVVVHGGGPQIDQMLQQLGVKPQRVDGIRITDEHTMQIVEMVLGAQVNQAIVSLIGQHGGRAVGLTGRDDSFLQATRKHEMIATNGNRVDPGRVGEVTEVRTQVIRQLIDGGFIPVIAPIAIDAQGNSLNVNADTAAGNIASALPARKLVLMTDTEGVRDKDGSIFSSLDAARISELETQEVIVGGMLPKVQCALSALKAGVRKAHIIDGRKLHAVLLEIFTDRGIGTEIT